MKKIHRNLGTVVLLAGLVTASGLGVFTQRVLANAVPALTRSDKPSSDKPDPNLVIAFKSADAIFTGKLAKVQPLGQTNSIPASIFGTVTFKDVKPLLGTVSAPSFSYSHREGLTQNLDLTLNARVLVAVKGKGVRVIVPATKANLAIAKKFIPAARGK